MVAHAGGFCTRMWGNPGMGITCQTTPLFWLLTMLSTCVLSFKCLMGGVRQCLGFLGGEYGGRVAGTSDNDLIAISSS